ncbi:T9SS type A sorting domain-containing protein [Spirosoma telluris]|uniref:T9SS type A sorting domain-containing protein n=1 Tax=Spirosoma telluris TaxID=2183553 RepID=UPI002FC2BA90
MVRLLGNPTTSNEITVEVTGAAGQSLRLGLSNSQGQLIGQQTISEAGSLERHVVRLGELPGVYFLQAITPTERKTIKVVRH